MAENVVEWASIVGGVANKIPNALVGTILYWILSVLSGIILVAILYGFLIRIISVSGYKCFGGKNFVKVNRWLMVASDSIDSESKPSDTFACNNGWSVCSC